jgi:HD-GYP domain-containing protein (c-di-GMP phosphodiesterase class II)
MRWINVENISVGMVLAKNMDVGGKTISKDSVIDDGLLKFFKENNVTWIPIKIKTISDQDLGQMEAITHFEGETDRKSFEEEKIEVPEYLAERSEVSQELYDEIEDISFDLIHDIRSGGSVKKMDVQLSVANIVSNIHFKDKTRSVVLEKAKRYDAYTFTHMVNVSVLSVLIGMQLGLDKKDLTDLGQGGLLHDTGKTKVPISIINKNGRLDQEELREIQKHPAYGQEILLESGIKDEGILAPVLQHHEKVDGSGYPYGLKDESIHFFAKIAAVADIYDALTTVRSYKKAMIPYKAVSIILSMVKHFDPKVIQAFINLMGLYPVGTVLELSNGNIAVVVETNVSSPLRPVVMYKHNQEIVDLSKEPLLIKRILENEEETK